MSITENQKYEELIVSYWQKRFNTPPDKIVTTRRNNDLRKESCEKLLEIFSDLKENGFHIYNISTLLEELISQETGYRQINRKIEHYEGMIHHLSKHLDLLGVEECIKILQRTKAIWANRTARWKSNRTPDKRGSRFIRSHMLHLLVSGSKILAERQKSKPLFNLSKASNQVSQLIALVGLISVKKYEDKGGLAEETLQKDYTKWLKSKVSVYEYPTSEPDGILKTVLAPETSLDSVL